MQQRYRPVIGVHKWFARRPGALFRSLLLAEFANGDLPRRYFKGNDLSGLTIGDPFMGGGTPLFEANRLGCSTVGVDINPMSHWVVRQELADLDINAFEDAAQRVVEDVEKEIGHLYRTTCEQCGSKAGVKYFLWVKTIDCNECGADIDLFRNYRVAKNERHPRYVYACPTCLHLNEVDSEDELSETNCENCGDQLRKDGPARRKYCTCPECGADHSVQKGEGVPNHRLYGIEYHCSNCYQDLKGRQFKSPDEEDHQTVEAAEKALTTFGDKYVPDAQIPDGDESSRLHRWGYSKYRELFTDRQLYGLSVLKKRIGQVEDEAIQEALTTVYSDFLRYQNMVCRYDKWALKIQDIFSVHGFPVSLEQCENSLLGIPGVGSGGYRHFVKKYARAKAYCAEPFECDTDRKEVQTRGEKISATFVGEPKDLISSSPRAASLHSMSSSELDLDGVDLDGVFTDPPYFANVQYAELIDFCYVWTKDLINGKVGADGSESTRRDGEVTVNKTQDRGLVEYTSQLSDSYVNFASRLKPDAPFVFTYHHNDSEAYVPVIAAILDAGLVCTSTLACPAEMGASVHISGTESSIVDSVFVCRKQALDASSIGLTQEEVASALSDDLRSLKESGMTPSVGDARCILLGHISRALIWHLHPDWNCNESTAHKIDEIKDLMGTTFPSDVIDDLVETVHDNYDRDGHVSDLFQQGQGADTARRD